MICLKEEKGSLFFFVRSLILFIQERKSVPNTLFLKFFEDGARIVSSKSKCIGQCSSDFSLLSLIECEIQIVINLGILITLGMIDRRRNDIIADRQNGEDGLHRTGCTQQVTCHGLRRTDIQLIGMVSKYLLDRLHF